MAFGKAHKIETSTQTKEPTSACLVLSILKKSLTVNGEKVGMDFWFQVPSFRFKVTEDDITVVEGR
jgi:hypothetical protein